MTYCTYNVAVYNNQSQTDKLNIPLGDSLAKQKSIVHSGKYVGIKKNWWIKKIYRGSRLASNFRGSINVMLLGCQVTAEFEVSGKKEVEWYGGVERYSTLLSTFNNRSSDD